MTNSMKVNINEETFVSFFTKMKKIFSANEGKLELGYNDGYYWETYKITKVDKGVKVVFDIGSFSGDIPCKKETNFLTWREFYNLIMNKKFKDKEMTLTVLIEKTMAMKYKYR